jgi:hypothetical protein
LSESYQYGLGGTTRGWRELAIQHLPQLRETICTATSHVDLWQRFKELLAEAGVGESRRAEVASVYDYAWWCVAISGDEDLAAEVGTYFYEDLPVFEEFDEQMPLFVSPSQFQRLESYFRYCLNDGEFADFRSRYIGKRTTRSECHAPPSSDNPD